MSAAQLMDEMRKPVDSDLQSIRVSYATECLREMNRKDREAGESKGEGDE